MTEVSLPPELLEKLEEVFKNEQRGFLWLFKTNPYLMAQKPVDVLKEEGLDVVLKALEKEKENGIIYGS